MVAQRNVSESLELMVIQFEIFGCISMCFIVFLEKCFKIINLFSINIYLTAVVKYRRKLRSHACTQRWHDMYIICFSWKPSAEWTQNYLRNRKYIMRLFAHKVVLTYWFFFTDFTFPISLPMISLSEYLYFCGFSPCVQIFIHCY